MQENPYRDISKGSFTWIQHGLPRVLASCLAAAHLFRYNILSFVCLIHLLFISTVPRAYKHSSARVRSADAGNGFRVFIPDISMLVVGLAICCSLVQKRAHEDSAEHNADFQLEELAWSIKYVSWLTLVFLIWSCSLCLERNLRCSDMLSSAFLVACDGVLMVLLYIWTFEDMGYIRVKGFFVTKKIRSSRFHLGFGS